MAYQYENVKLEKGMYGQNGRSFLKVLESLDPSENYKGTALEGLDAFQRQLKRFDIHVKGAGSDMVEKFFHTSESSVLFPEFVSRVVRQGMESDILPDITATVTNFDGMDYRSIASVPTDDDKELKRVEEGAGIPTTSIRTQENLVKLHKRGRMLVASYEDPLPATGSLLCDAAPDRRVHRAHALKGRHRRFDERRRQQQCGNKLYHRR